MATLYISHETYFGMSRRRPLVPEGEVWVFRRVDGESYVVRGADRNILPPAPPLFASSAMTIYKFHRKIDLPWSLLLFTDIGLPITIKTNVLVFLHDPVQLIAYLHNPDSADEPPVIEVNKLEKMDLDALRPMLEVAIEGALKEEGQIRGTQSLSADDYDITVPLSFSQLLPETDLSFYIQNKPEFKIRGIEVRVIVSATPILHSYGALVQKAELAMQEHLLPLQREMSDLVASIEREKLQGGARIDFAEQGPTLQKELYQSHYEQIQRMRQALYPIIEYIVQQSKMLIDQPIPPTLVIAIFNDVIFRTIKQALQRVTVTRSSSLASTSQVSDDGRAGQLRTLYLTASAKGWKLLPFSQEKVKEEITFDLGNETKFLLIVPSTYPGTKVNPVVTDVKKQGTRQSQSDINKITGPVIQSNSYDLNILVETVAIELLKP